MKLTAVFVDMLRVLERPVHLQSLVIQAKENRMQISLLTIHYMGEKKMKEKTWMKISGWKYKLRQIEEDIVRSSSWVYKTR